jgi:hypothetical protein
VLWGIPSIGVIDSVFLFRSFGVRGKRDRSAAATLDLDADDAALGPANAKTKVARHDENALVFELLWPSHRKIGRMATRRWWGRINVPVVRHDRTGRKPLVVRCVAGDSDGGGATG